jgi:GTP-binding protein EngB required for normal cell division
MSTTLAERGDALAAALDAGEGRLPAGLVAEGRSVLRRARERAGLSAEHTVVALAGATGSGKSSLLNALAGADLARTGIQRPTTAHALAAVWGSGAGPLLDWLEVRDRRDMGAGLARLRRRGGPPVTGLVLLDLPDHDSVVEEHRVRADRLVQRADLLVWVVDPQKYADAALHTHYLRSWAGHESVTVIVLNQADRLSDDQARAVLTDLRRLAAADGLSDVQVLATSARTGQGVDELRGLLGQAAARRRAATDRWAADERAVAERVVAACGPAAPARLAAGATDRLEAALRQVAGVDVVTDAVRRAAVRRARAHTGWPPVRWLARLRPDPLRRLHLSGLHPDGEAGGGQGATPEHTSLPPTGPATRARAAVAVRDLVADAMRGAPEPWAVAARERATADGLAEELDRAVAATPLLPDRPAWWWRVVGWLQWLLLATAVVGLGWLGVVWLVGYLQLPPLETPRWGALPVPTWLAIGGVVAGWLVAGLGALAGRLGARRRARAAGRRLAEAVSQVARRRVLGPVAEELTALDTCRRQAALAASRS